MCPQAKDRWDHLRNCVVPCRSGRIYNTLTSNLASYLQRLFSFVFVCFLGTLESSTPSTSRCFDTFQYHPKSPQEGLNPEGLQKSHTQALAVVSRRLKEPLATGLEGVSPLGYIQPIGSLVRFAGVNVDDVLAVAALHSATPLELTLALGDAFDTHGVVAPPAAHDLAAVGTSGGLVAHPARCSQGTWKKKTYLCVTDSTLFLNKPMKVEALG